MALSQIRTFHYAPHWQLLDWVRLGWIVAKPNCQMYMDEYAVTVEFLCDCKMVKPLSKYQTGSPISGLKEVGQNAA